MATIKPESAYDPELSYGSGPIERLSVILLKFFRNITIEPVVFLYSLGFSVTIIISPNLYFEKTCLVGSEIFGNGSTFNESVCDNIDNGNYDNVQEYVQKTVTTMNLVTMFVKGIPPIIFALFIGPWSDRFGRKFLIIFPLIGYVLYDVWFLVNVVFFDTFAVEFLMLEVIQYWFGGYMCLFLGLYSYVSDISDQHTRTVRIALVDFVFFTGMAIGSGVSGKLSTKFGYAAIYGAAGVLQLLAITYAVFFVKTSEEIRQYKGMPIKEGKKNGAEKASCGSIFSLANVKQSFVVAFQKRPGSYRHVVIILISLFGMYGFANNGISSINIPYARAKFQWESSDKFNEWWSAYQSLGTVFNLVAIGLVMPIFTQLLKLRDMTITGFCVASSFMGITMILLATKPELLYVANFLRMFSDVVTVGIRSALSKIVGENDVGKVFACVGAVQALVGLVSPVYNLIYTATYDWHLGFVYCISCTILALMFGLTMYVNMFMRIKEKKSAKLQVERDEADGVAVICEPKFSQRDFIEVA